MTGRLKRIKQKTLKKRGKNKMYDDYFSDMSTFEIVVNSIIWGGLILYVLLRNLLKQKL